MIDRGKLAYLRWLASSEGPRPAPFLRSFRPRLTSRVLLGLPREVHVPSPPRVKIVAIRRYARQHGLKTFVETGTCTGTTTFALRDDFDAILTFELSPDLHRRAAMMLAPHRNVVCIRGDSGVLLPLYVDAIASIRRAPALFFLDAHASGGETVSAGYDPVFKELEAVMASPLPHVVLIDDARGHDLDRLRKIAAGRRFAVRNDIVRIEP